MPKRIRPTTQTYVIIAATVVVIAIAALLMLMGPAASKRPTNSVMNPQNGSYRIVEVQDVVCTLSYPPTCGGKLIVSEEEMDRTEVEVGRNTKVRYQTKEIQIFPGDLRAGMVGQITFEPNSATIDTMVITN